MLLEQEQQHFLKLESELLISGFTIPVTAMGNNAETTLHC